MFSTNHSIPINVGPDRYVSIMDRANEVAASVDKRTLIDGMLELMLDITQAESATFFEMDPKTGEFVLTSVLGHNASQHLVGLRLTPNQVLPDYSIQGTQPVVIGDLPSNHLWLRTTDPVGAADKHNMINLSVCNKVFVLGVIQIFNYEEVELDLLVSLSNRLAGELHHRSQLTKSEQSNQRLMKLLDVLGEAAGTLDRSSLLHLITENTSQIVDAERCSLFLVDPETKEMIFQVAYQSSHEPPKTPQKPPPPTDQKASEREKEIPTQPNDGFKYFNKSAITMPLTSMPLDQGQHVQKGYVLGGLMALTKPDSSFDEEDARLMQILANQTSTFIQVAEMYESAGELYLGAIKALVSAIDAKDPYTQGHSHRVSDYSVLISKELKLDEEQINDIRIGSLLHDIGKIGIPDSVLLKTDKLTAEEYEIIKKHPTTGVNILSQVRLLEPMLPAIAEHHERLNGSGYPGGLSGKNISLMGRIVAVADVFDAMTSHRPYRPAISVSEVLEYLEENAGFLFDPDCVEALGNIIRRSS